MNRESYDRVAERWNGARMDFYGRERAYLDALLEGLTAPSRILDLGCGTGCPMADHVITAGHALTGVDQSKAMLAFARLRHPQACWIEAPIEEFEARERYAAIICWDTLFHLPREHHAGLLSRMATWLRPGGRLMITVGGSAHPAFTDIMFGETFFYDSHPPERVHALLDERGFMPLIAEFMNPPTDGRDKGRYAIVAELKPSRS